MTSTVIDRSYHNDLINALELSHVDQLLFHIAYLSLQLGGHRYGSFLDAATNAAKLAIYVSYRDNGYSLNKTGLLHHIEPKRVKEIIREVESLINQPDHRGGPGHQEPEFLIGVPNLWVEKFPWQGVEPPVTIDGLTFEEMESLTVQLPPDRPRAKIINEIEFFELLDVMHNIAHQPTPLAKSKPFSNALREHYAFKVLHSGMVVKIRQSLTDMALYALIRMSYSPRQLSAKLNTLFSDLVHTIEILQLWLSDSPKALRALETLEILPQNQPEALAELDQLLRIWADKYHDDKGESMMLQLAAGPHNLP